MSLEVGHKLAHYEIVAPIGKGGMGDELERPAPGARQDCEMRIYHHATRR